jgi:2-methylisocitrate lyase-like PEP mutase family enzyme
MTRTVAEKRAEFRALHEQGCFVIPNPWDAGSARWLASLGFPALATTSSGSAWSAGRADGSMSRDQVLAHLRTIVGATDLPVNADFENGFGHDPAEVAESVTLAAGTGVAGISVEDTTGDRADPVFPLDVAVDRLRAARAALDANGPDTLLVGRADGFIAGRPDLDDILRRLQAYAAAGADCLYAPGLSSRDEIAAAVAAVAPKPLNVLVGAATDLTVADFAALGVRRVSIGGALARAAWAGFQRAAGILASDGRFDGLRDAAPGADLNAFFDRFAD